MRINIIFLFLFSASGCTLFKLPVETVKTAGTIVKTTGQVVGAVGGGVSTAVNTTSNVFAAAGHATEAVVQAKAAQVAVKAIVK